MQPPPSPPTVPVEGGCGRILLGHAGHGEAGRGDKALNPDVAIEVNQSDSTTGVNMATEGTCDIGMVSRELKDSEKGGVSAQVIAQDASRSS